jgi:hypothetical protein
VQAVTKDRFIPDKRSAIELPTTGGDTISLDNMSSEITNKVHTDCSHTKGLNAEQKQVHDM